MPWDFRPATAKMKVHPGEVYQTSFFARNGTSVDMVGQAIPSVAPGKAARYFSKTECFCFSQQPLKAGASAELPLRFVIDPALPDDVNTVTLAYTFFDVTNRANDGIVSR